MRGIFLIDHSIVFDGGWRILSGQRPFVDFFAPFGPVTYWLQALYFALFGVSFSSFVALASTLNAAATALVFFLLCAPAYPQSPTPTPLWIPLSAACLTASNFQSAFGIPFMENVAFFFLLLCLAGLSPSLPQRWAGPAAFVSGIAAVVAFFSKQNAAVLFAPIVLLLLWERMLLRPASRFRGLLPFFAGLLFASLAFLLWIWIFTDPALFWRHFYELPAAVGRQRLGSAPTLLKALLFSGPPVVAKFIHIALLLGSAAIAFLAYFSRRETPYSILLLRSLLVMALLWFHALFQMSSYQDPENGMPFLGLAFGLFARNLLTFSQQPRAQSLFPPAAQSALPALAVSLALLLAARNVAFAWSRGAHQFPAGTTFTEVLQTPALRGVHWGNPTPMGGEGAPLSARDFEALIAFLRSRKEAFFVFPDSTILYGVTQQPSIGPLLFNYSEYLYAKSDIPRLDQSFARYFRHYQVKWFVLETVGSPARLSMYQDFPFLRRTLREDFVLHSVIGPYSIYQLRP